MGKLFGNLTNPGVTDPSSGLTQQTSGPGAAGMLQGAMAAKTAQPVSMNMEGDAAGDQTSYGFDKPPQVGPQPKQVTPSFLSASHSGTGGMASPLSSQLTTKGKILATVLQLGLGGAAGWAAGRQGNPREGYAGPAAGFQAGMQLPFFQAQQKQGIQQGQAQLAETQAKTGLTQAQAEQAKTSVTVTGPDGSTYHVPESMIGKILPGVFGAQAHVKGAEIGAEGRTSAAKITAGKPVVVPGRGLFQKDESGAYKPVEGAEVPSVLVTPEEAQSLGHPELANQELDMGRYSQLLRGTASQTTPVQGAAGPSLVNKVTGKTRGLGLGAPSMSRPVQVAADPNNPGNLTYTTAGEAIKSGAAAPQSAPTQAAKAVTKSAVAGPIGNEINAYRTAIEHAKLVKQVALALKNGDTRTLNSLRNRFQTEFGSSKLNDLHVVLGAYSREVTKMLSSGHMTDSEIGQAGATLPDNANADTLISAANLYQKLAEDKMKLRKQQVEQGQKGKPNFSTESATPAPAGGDPFAAFGGKSR